MKKRHFLILFPLFLYLLFSPEAALVSARSGLMLWYHSVLPVLFPFMLLCGITLRIGALEQLPRVLCRPLERLFGCSRFGTFAIVTGFLCGFPMGAKITSDLFKSNKITQDEAFFLHGFVNNLSPAFILSYLASDQMQNASMGIWFLAAILGGAVLYGLITSVSFRRKNSTCAAASFSPGAERFVTGGQSALFSSIDDCINESIQNTVRLGAYIMIFAILSGAAAQVVPMKNTAVLFLTSCIEVTNGISLLSHAGLGPNESFLLLTALCAFGGLSALAQSAGIAGMDRRLFLHYVKSRVLHTLLSVSLSVIIILLR